MKMLLKVARRGVSVCFLCACSLPAADVSFYGIVKLQSFLQTNAASVPPLPSNAYAFASFVMASANFAVTNATVQPGGGTVYPLALETNSGVLLGFTNYFSSQTALDSAFPTSGGSIIKTPVNYTVTMRGVHDGLQSGGLSFYLLAPVLQISVPTTPRILNFAEAQAIDTTRDFVLQWNDLSGAVTSILEVIVLDAANNVVTNSPLPGEPGALGQNATRFTLAANTLPPGTNLSAQLLIANPGLPNTSSYSGATGIPALAKTTFFPLVTRPAPVAPRLSASLVSSQQLRLQFASEAARLYRLEASAAFTAWAHVLDTNGTGADIVLTLPASDSQRFYRLKVGQ